MRLLCFIMIAVVFLPAVSLACSEVPGYKAPSVKEVADGVLNEKMPYEFAGKVKLVSLENKTEQSPILKFDVLKQYRGDQIATIKTLTSVSSCDKQAFSRLKVGDEGVLLLTSSDKNEAAKWKIWEAPYHIWSAPYVGDASSFELEKTLDEMVIEKNKVPEAAE